MLWFYSFMQCIFFGQSSILTLSSTVFLSFFPTLSFILSMSYSLCFYWLSLLLCGFFVAKLEQAVSISSSVQAPILAAPQPHGSLQVLQSSSPPIGLLAGICTCVACRSVRPKILQTFPSFSHFFLSYCIYCFLIALL